MYSFVIKKIAKFDLEIKSKQKITVYLSGSPESHCGEEFSRYMKDKNITDIFCFCEPTYNIQIFKQHNINFHNIMFPDGTPPTKDTLKTFNILLNKIFNKNKNVIINMHCASGLGRAPTMLAYLMIKYCDVNNIESILEIRKKIKGSLNNKQLVWIQHGDFNDESQCCIIM